MVAQSLPGSVVATLPGWVSGGAASVLNTKSAQEVSRCAEAGESHVVQSPPRMGSDDGIARTSSSWVGRRRLGQTKEKSHANGVLCRECRRSGSSKRRRSNSKWRSCAPTSLSVLAGSSRNSTFSEMMATTGAKLQRPGLDALRDQAARAAFDVVLVTAPDRLARNYVHQMVILEELERHGISVVFIDRPPSDDPHEQLVLRSGALSPSTSARSSLTGCDEDARPSCDAGRLLPWTNAAYGYRVHPDRPRDPALVEVEEAAAAVVRELFQAYADGEATLHALAVRLTRSRYCLANWPPLLVRHQCARDPDQPGVYRRSRQRASPESPLPTTRFGAEACRTRGQYPAYGP